MKIFLALFFFYLSYSVNAFEPKKSNKNVSNYYSSSLLPEINLSIHQQGFERIFSLNYGAVKLKTNYSSSNTLRAPAVVSIQEQNSDFYLHSELTIQSSNNFDISMSANIYQRNLLSNNTLSNSLLTHSNINPKGLSHNSLSSLEMEPYYSLIGNYSISSHWQLSGGIMFTDFLNIWDDNQNNINDENIALVKTSYSF